jgi:hypothetical protein
VSLLAGPLGIAGVVGLLVTQRAAATSAPAPEPGPGPTTTPQRGPARAPLWVGTAVVVAVAAGDHARDGDGDEGRYALTV